MPIIKVLDGLALLAHSGFRRQDDDDQGGGLPENALTLDGDPLTLDGETLVLGE